MHTQISPTVPELCHMAARLVADETGVPLSEVLHACRLARPVSATRALAMYLAHVGLGLPMSAVGRAFGRHRSTVAHACRTVEERRETARWDRKVSELEARMIRALAQVPAGEALHAA
ncbi:helix-turn-helix domain-containing protein [Ancylobacter mangrovi]|uniref:helix-turn-helix domain-containing protein n=1 Tax=Ancylobacter mangrovi TaxID=2972472 RepID=UPI002163C0B2|nr:helix-turn-helix domain-containing protein [Ancylobacter mangrovi]MCS0501057.1 chromosomal replication initiator DnaA [Ancylobacter mangrovi]